MVNITELEISFAKEEIKMGFLQFCFQLYTRAK